MKKRSTGLHPMILLFSTKRVNLTSLEWTLKKVVLAACKTDGTSCRKVHGGHDR